MAYLGDDENGEDPAVVELVSGICRKCEAEIIDVPVDEAEQWEEEHRVTCPRRDELAIW